MDLLICDLPARAADQPSLNLSTDGAGYLPPGTDLGYYYSIRDATGNVHETPHPIFEQVDNRFAWEKTRAGPLTLLYHDVPQSQVAVVAQEVESELRRIGHLLQINLDQPIKGVIYKTGAPRRWKPPISEPYHHRGAHLSRLCLPIQRGVRRRRLGAQAYRP